MHKIVSFSSLGHLIKRLIYHVSEIEFLTPGTIRTVNEPLDHFVLLRLTERERV